MAESTELSDISVSDERIIRGINFVPARLLGQGSYAKVYLTEKQDLELPWACKVINTKKAPKEFVTKFLVREIDILQKISHPNIVHIYDIMQREDKFLIFMRCAELGDLLDYVLEKGELQEQLAKVWSFQLCLSIEYLHAMNIAHRDIKCDNVLITQNLNVKLADFGFARFVADATGKPVTSSTYCGSLAYVSPEILKGKPYYPKYSDVWSLGIVVYIMLNKCMPFNDVNVKALYKQQMGKNWKIRTRILPKLTPNAIAFIHKLLEPDYRKRNTIEQMVRDPWFLQDGLEMTEEERKALENVGTPLTDRSVRYEKSVRNLAAPTDTSTRVSLEPVLENAIESRSSLILKKTDREIWQEEAERGEAQSAQ